jgi:hypothetical protein
MARKFTTKPPRREENLKGFLCANNFASLSLGGENPLLVPVFLAKRLKLGNLIFEKDMLWLTHKNSFVQI